MSKSKMISQLLLQEESDILDFKREISLMTDNEKQEFAKDISAFANTKGGHILYGVEDATKLVRGIDPATFDEAKMQQIISARCSPPARFTVELFSLQGLPVALVTIPNSMNKPHQIIQTGAIYIRRGSTNDTAKVSEIAAMLNESKRVPPQTAAEIFKKMNSGLLEVASVRCRSILICPSVPVDGIINISKETTANLKAFIPGELFGAYTDFPTQNSYVIESAGRIADIPRRRIEVFSNGLIFFRRLEDMRDYFVYGQIVEREFTQLCEYANNAYIKVARLEQDIELSLSMNEVLGRHLSLNEHDTLFLEEYETCKQNVIVITRKTQVPIHIENIFASVLQELKRCFGRL